MMWPNTFNYYWRLVVTGSCFLLFGAGVVLVSALFLPLRAAPISGHKKQALARALIGLTFRLYTRVMTASGALKLTVNGVEKLRAKGSRLVIANHPTLIDAVILISLLPDVICIAKSELNRSFFMRWLIQGAGYITNARPEGLLNDCRETLQSGRSLLLFPEGTRSTPGQPLKLLRGAAQIALRAEHDLTPVVITCVPPALLKGQKWYQIPRSGPVNMVFEVQDDIVVAPYQAENEGISLRSRKLTRYLTDYFHQHLRGPADLQRET